MSSWLKVCLFAVLVAFQAVAPAGAGETGRLVVITDTGRHVFAVEAAVTPAERATGLMNRDSMPADHGMIFRFDRTRAVTMWMKSTLIPLDMLFVRADGTIAGIHADAEPLSEATVASPEPVRFVIELNGGTAKAIGATPGDRIEHALVPASEASTDEQ